MSYDTDLFNREKKRILKKCKSIKSKRKQIDFLIQERINHQQRLSEQGEPSMYCDTFADTAKPEGGGDDPLIIWLFNETERRRATLTKNSINPEWNITKIEELNPATLYPRRIIAKILGVTLRTIENWIHVGVRSASGCKIHLKDTPHKNARLIKGRDLLDFLNKRNIPPEE